MSDGPLPSVLPHGTNITTVFDNGSIKGVIFAPCQAYVGVPKGHFQAYVGVPRGHFWNFGDAESDLTEYKKKLMYKRSFPIVHAPISYVCNGVDPSLNDPDNSMMWIGWEYNHAYSIGDYADGVSLGVRTTFDIVKKDILIVCEFALRLANSSPTDVHTTFFDDMTNKWMTTVDWESTEYDIPENDGFRLNICKLATNYDIYTNHDGFRLIVSKLPNNSTR